MEAALPHRARMQRWWAVLSRDRRRWTLEVSIVVVV
jgi:hypothetical protein